MMPWAFITNNIQRYPNITLAEERRLIANAQKGSIKSKNELILRHVGFLAGRIRKIVFPDCLKRFGDDLLAEGIVIINTKIDDYDMTYCNRQGVPTPVRLRSYIWKRIDGFIIDYLKKEFIYQSLDET
jgi:DNA-directed RNA polymerase specialized sigma subunit